MARRLHVVISSTRPGRVGPSVAQWFHGFAATQGAFEAVLVDLADFKLPVFDEPEHPRLQKYQHAHTRAWSESVRHADAFVFVMPEYNYGPPPSLVNALNYLVGGMGLRACRPRDLWRHLGRPALGPIGEAAAHSARMMPLPDGVAIPFVTQHLDANRAFTATEQHQHSAKTLLDELARWTDALVSLRAERKKPPAA
jgi:NAD(P)H-dependent FMN reductase